MNTIESMKIKIIGKISEALEEKISKGSYLFVDDSKEADFVIISSSVKSYFLNTKIGEIIQEAYSLEFDHGRPIVLDECEFLKKNQVVQRELSL